MLTTVILAPGACWGRSNPTVLAQNRYKTGQNRPAPEITGRVPGILGPYMAPLEPYKTQIWPIHGQKKKGHIYGLYMAMYTDYILPIYRYISAYYSYFQYFLRRTYFILTLSIQSRV